MYTPVTTHIKLAYVFDQVSEAKALGVYEENVTEAKAKEDFDRWFNSQKAMVWEEGYGDCWKYHQSQGMIGTETNPYKEKS